MSNDAKGERSFLDILKDYQSDVELMMAEDPRVALLMKILNEDLSREDRTIILLYLEHQSYRKVGAKLCVSHMTARSEVLRVVADIRAKYEQQSKGL